MKLNRLLVVAAVMYALAGLGLVFAPAEVLGSFRPSPAPRDAWAAQLLGGALLGLAMLNWLQRYAATGGVLGRPVLLANLVFLTVSFFASLGLWRSEGDTATGVSTIILGLLAAAFGGRTFLPPRPGEKEPERRP